MTGRKHIASAFVVAALMLCGFAPTILRTRSRHRRRPRRAADDAERALVAQHPNEWAQLKPEQRERVLENYRRWQSMRPEDRENVRQNFQTFRNLPPEERKRVLEGLRKWRQLPQARREELQQDYARYRGLPPDQRDRDEAIPAVRAASARAARTDARELASMAADDAGAAPRSASQVGTLAPASARDAAAGRAQSTRSSRARLRELVVK